MIDRTTEHGIGHIKLVLGSSYETLIDRAIVSIVGKYSSNTLSEGAKYVNSRASLSLIVHN